MGDFIDITTLEYPDGTRIPIKDNNHAKSILRKKYPECSEAIVAAWNISRNFYSKPDAMGEMIGTTLYDSTKDKYGKPLST